MLQEVHRDNQTATADGGKGPNSDVRAGPDEDYDDGLLAVGIPIMVGAYATAIAIVLMTFMGSGEAVFAIAICAVYMVMYFGVPLVMTRLRNRYDKRWHGDTPAKSSGTIVVFTGSIRRHEAILQMVIVPISVAFAFAALSVVVHFVR